MMRAVRALRRVGFFIDLIGAEWLDASRVVSMASGSEPIGIAVARSMVVLGDDTLISENCSRLSCVSPSAVPRLRKALSEGLRIFRETLLDSLRHLALESSDPDRVLKAVSSCAREAIHYMDMVVSRCETEPCIDLGALACFIPRGSVRVEGRTVEAPVILVNIAKVNSIVESIASSIAVEDRRYSDDIETEFAKNRLLAAILAHEVTHAYTDLSPEDAPCKTLRGEAQGVYHQIIEEALATHYAINTLLHLDIDITNTLLLAKILENQPPEYRAGLAVYHYLNHIDKELLALWTRIMMPPPSLATQLAPLIYAALLTPANHSITTRLLLYPHKTAERYLRHLLLKKLTYILTTALGTDLETLENFLWRTLALWLATTTPKITIRQQSVHI